MEGNKVYCRMVVAEDMDAGHNLAGALKAGYHPGYSIRGAGDTIPKGDHEVITDNYTLITIDVVGNPSFGKSAIVNSRYESQAMPKNMKALTESANNLRREVAVNHRLRDLGYRQFEVSGFMQFAYSQV